MSEPRLSGDFLISGWDKSGSHRRSAYEVHGFVFIDAKESQEWFKHCEELHREFLPDGRRMSYKNLNDTCRQRALIPFLKSTEQLCGICCLVGISKKYRNMAAPLDMNERLRSSLRIVSAKWKPSTLEAALRTIILWTVILKEVAVGDQDVTWILDDDDIVANEALHDDVLQLADRIASVISVPSMRELCICTPGKNEHISQLEDIAAIPDLSAGAFSDAVNRFSPFPNSGSQSHEFQAIDMRMKAEIITEWYFAIHSNFRRVAVLIDRETPTGFSIKRIQLKDPILNGSNSADQ